MPKSQYPMPYEEEVSNHDFPWGAMRAIISTLKLGKDQGHPVGGWKNITIQEHIGKAIHHLGYHLAGKVDEPHLEMALTRLAFAVHNLRENTWKP